MDLKNRITKPVRFCDSSYPHIKVKKNRECISSKWKCVKIYCGLWFSLTAGLHAPEKQVCKGKASRHCLIRMKTGATRKRYR